MKRDKDKEKGSITAQLITKINLKIPKRPNFNNKPASHNDIEESTSQ